MEINFKKDTEIDAGNLDIEYVNAARIASEYAEMLADAKDRQRRSEQKLKIIKSELTLKIKDEDPKATAPIIEATYRTNKEHIAEKKVWLDASYDVDMLYAAVQKLNDKKESLAELAKLEARGYYTSGDGISREMPQMNKERIHEIQCSKEHQEVVEKMQERSRRTR